MTKPDSPLPSEGPPRAAVNSPSADNAGLAQKQKLDCALQLARTVSADFNNVLTGILGHVSLLLAKSDTVQPWKESLLEIQKAAEKGSEIAADLAAFSRQEKDGDIQGAGNLNAVIQATVRLFQSPANEGIQWQLELVDRLYSAKFDEAKIQQALIKVIENAVEAINKFGRIEIRTRNHEVTDGLCDGAIRLPPGLYVSIEVKDSSTGIPADVLPRVFEPFFTTKGSPHRGLGLVLVYGIVSNHGGRVTVASESSKGVAVRIYLPAERKVVQDSSHEITDLKGKETVLFIDDEPLLLTMGEMILSNYGYRVLTADGGQKGIELFRRRSNEIDLVIADLVMPDVSGREVVEKIREYAAHPKIILMTGCGVRTGWEDKQEFLQKPFTSEDLLRKARQILRQA